MEYLFPVVRVFMDMGPELLEFQLPNTYRNPSYVEGYGIRKLDGEQFKDHSDFYKYLTETEFESKVLDKDGVTPLKFKIYKDNMGWSWFNNYNTDNAKFLIKSREPHLAVKFDELARGVLGVKTGHSWVMALKDTDEAQFKYKAIPLVEGGTTIAK
ncbi:hypothetical protein BDV96DRAFT_649960 [Lophiotrema nucula]|uniref:Uncharacterized protein n=1 Tax=Lophiotrema nucula TaxID=690887 RepID=A0A6A5YWE1_9PLEO|nr:hypothetical protein BDV96DRAFT_649960 [Lophiotrema nucula]